MRKWIIAVSLFAVLLSSGSMILPYTTLNIDDSFFLIKDVIERFVELNTKTGLELKTPLLSPLFCIASFILIAYPNVKRFIPFILAMINLLLFAVFYRINFTSLIMLIPSPVKPGIGYYAGLSAAIILFLVSIWHWAQKQNKKRKPNVSDLLDVQ